MDCKSKIKIFCVIRCMHQSFPTNLSNNISFASQAGDDVGAITENIDSDTSLSGQSDELSPEGSLTTGYASISFQFLFAWLILADE